MSVVVIFPHFPLEKYYPRGEVEVAPFVRRWGMWCTKAALEHRRGSLD